MKVIQEMLGHVSLSVTSDLYSSVLPDLAHSAAGAAAALVPRTPRNRWPHQRGKPLTQDLHNERGLCTEKQETPGVPEVSAVSTRRAPVGIRTPNLLIAAL